MMDGLNFIYNGKPTDKDVEMVNVKQQDSCWKFAKLGKLYAKTARYDEAHAAFNRAIEMEPSELSFYFQRGVIRFRLADMKGAFVDMKKAKAGNPWNLLEVLNYLACIQFRLGDYQGAKENVARVLNANRGLLNDLIMTHDEYVQLTSKYGEY